MLFPLQNCAQYLSQCMPALKVYETGLSVDGRFGRIELSVKPMNMVTADKLIVAEEVRAAYRLFTPIAAHLDQVNAIDKFCLISSLDTDADNLVLGASSRIQIFKGDDRAAAELYAPLISTELAVIEWHFQRLLSARPHATPEECVVTQYVRLPDWISGWFDFAGKTLREQGYCCNAGETGLTVEFPWDDGAFSSGLDFSDLHDELGLPKAEAQRMNGQTSLFTLRSEVHPMYGAGLLANLVLPVRCEGEAFAYQLCAQLNEMELEANFGPPQFGAWVLGDRGITHVTFTPAEFLVANLPMNLSTWARVRSAQTRAALGNMSSEQNTTNYIPPAA